MLSPSDRRTTLLRLSCLGLALTMMSRPHLGAAPADPPPLRGLEEVSHAQVEHLQRRWQAGDLVELDLPMPVHRVYAHEQVQDDQGQVALMRGPVVYCLEAVDHTGVDLAHLALPRETELRAEHRADLLGGVTVLQGQAVAAGQRPVTLIAVPYYAWQNRGQHAMTVWIPQTSQPGTSLPHGRAVRQGG